MKTDELASSGLQAYQSGEYASAASYLTLLLERQPKLWTCRLYLAMAYYRAGECKRAEHELKTIAQFSTDQTIKKRALEALTALNATRRESAVASSN
jgi:thioredoxin-like negative regulator of GroEL